MHKFEIGKTYRTRNGTAKFKEDCGHGLSFSHQGNVTREHLWHERDGRCTGRDEEWRAYDIIGPLTTRPTITIEYGDDTGWVLKDGDKTADKMDPIELLSLVGCLVLKTPLPCLRWLKTAEQREREEKHRAEQQAEREKEREATAQQQQQDAAALDELRSFVGQYSSFDTLQQIVDWVKANYKVDQFDLITPLHNQIHDCCDSAGIPRHVELGGKRHSVLRPQQRLALLHEAAVDGKKVRQKLERLTGFIQGMA